MPVYVLSMLWSSMGGQVSTNASVVCRGGDGTQADFLHLLLPLRSTSVVMGWVWHAHLLDGPLQGMVNIMSGMIVNYLNCARCVCVCTCVHVYESETHGVWRQRAWSKGME